MIIDESPFANETFPGHFRLIGNMLEHIANGEELMVKPEETLHVTAVIEAFYRSAAQGREVLVSEVEGLQ